MSAGTGTIVANGLSKRFGQKLALAPLELTLGPGGIIGLLGPNGSGKSTFLRLLTGLVRPDSGRASVDGVVLAGDGTAIRARSTYSPGEIALYGELVAREHLAWLLRGREAEALPRALALANELELPLEKRVRAYSHGMKRQLLFAAALAPRVRVRILDELTEGLDPHKRSAVLEHLLADARSGTTILLSSHHLGEVDRVCERLVFLHEGRKLADETAADVARRAQRLVKLAYADEHEASRAAREFGPLATSVRAQGRRLVLMLEQDDPRAFLAEFAQRRALAPPCSIEYGALSLGELYRELYGVEGC